MTQAINVGQEWRDRAHPRRMVTILEAGSVIDGVEIFKIKPITLPDGKIANHALEQITSGEAIRAKYELVRR